MRSKRTATARAACVESRTRSGRLLLGYCVLGHKTLTGEELTEEAVCKVVAEQIGITPDQAHACEDLWGVGLTSLAAVRILMDLEDEYAITFPPELLTRATFSTVARLAAVVESALEPAGGQSQGAA